MKLKIKNNYILTQCVLALAVTGFMIMKKIGTLSRTESKRYNNT